jgi:hypothetical protein
VDQCAQGAESARYIDVEGLLDFEGWGEISAEVASEYGITFARASSVVHVSHCSAAFGSISAAGVRVRDRLTVF